MNNLKRISIAASLIFVVFLIGFFWWQNGIQPVNSHDKSEKMFLIQKATGMREIANNLKKDGLIKDPVVFFLLIKQLGLDSKIQAGDFRLSPSMSATDIAKNLTVGTLDIWVTIPEGKRATEIATILKEKMPAYTDTWENSLITHEGFLFPDTYLLPREADITQITTLLTNTFDEKYATITPTQSKLTKLQIVTLASLIEREAKHAVDRPMVASVLLNRLEIGMPLQIDATIQYALGYQTIGKTWWKKELTYDDLKITSPYNTYVNVGIPPGPIANPGLSSMDAVIHPADTEYIYYISDKSGVNHYAKTLTEHNANIKKYGL